MSNFDEGQDGLKFNPFTHCWSLGVEEQFYFLFPLLVLVAFGPRVVRTMGGRDGSTRTIRPGTENDDEDTETLDRGSYCLCGPRGYCRPTVLLTCTLLVSATTCIIMTASASTLAYYLLPSRCWQLMAGALLLVIQDANPYIMQLGAKATVFLEIAAIGLTALAITITPSEYGFPMPWSLLAIIGAVCAIASGAMPRRHLIGSIHTPLLARALSHPNVVYVGKLSYPLYLWHWPTIVLFRWTIGVSSLGNRVFAVNVALIGAIFIYHCIEGPVRCWRPKKRSHVLVAFLPLIGLVILWLGLLRGPLMGKLYFDPTSRPATMPPRASSQQGGLTTAPSPLPLLRASPPPPILPPPVWPGSPSSPPPKPPLQTPTYPPDPPQPPMVPPSPVSPPPPAAPLCMAPTNDRGSIYSDLHQRPSTTTEVAELSTYSTFSRRACECQNVSGMVHSPVGASVSSDVSLPPCFVERAVTDEPLMHMSNIESALAAAPCFLDLGGFVASSCDDPDDCHWGERQIDLLVQRCLTPARTGPRPQRTLFLVGDSHAASLAPGLMAAVDGAVDMVWAAAGSGCGVIPDTIINSLFSPTSPDRNRRFSHDICVAWNLAVFRAFEQQVRPCDIVVYHQERKKLRIGYQPPFLVRLQTLVTGLGASFVIIGDTVKLPQRGTYCIPSAYRPDAAAACSQPLDRVNHPTQADLNDGHVTLITEEEQYTTLAQSDGTYFFSIYNLMCDTTQQKCGAFVPGTSTLAYFDRQHLPVPVRYTCGRTCAPSSDPTVCWEHSDEEQTRFVQKIAIRGDQRLGQILSREKIGGGDAAWC